MKKKNIGTYAKAICLSLSLLCNTTMGTIGSNIAYVGNYGNNTVSIVDTSTSAVTGLINDPDNTFNEISYITFNPNGNTAYVAGYPGTISIIDTATNTVTGTITTVNTPLYSLAITPDGSKLYAVNISFIDVIDTATNTVITTISGLSSSHFMVITSDGTTGYISNFSGNNVLILDVATNTITGQIPLTFNGPFPLVLSPDGTKLYVANNNDNTISVVNIPAYTLAQTITNVNFSDIYWLAITPNGKTLYVNNFESGKVSAVNTSTYAVTNVPGSTLGEIYYGVVTPDGSSYVVASYTSSTVTVISTTTNTITGTVNDTEGPFDGSYPIAMFFAVTVRPPSTVAGCKTQNIFLTQVDLINRLTWTPPLTGNVPISYAIYRDAALTDLAGTVPANGPLLFLDHNRSPNVLYTYYIVSIDQYNNVSGPQSVTVAQNC